MTEDHLVEFLFYLLPAVVVGLVAYYFFNMHTTNEERRRKFLLHRENQKQALPVRLQAYERMSLFLERTSPGNLLLRVKPSDQRKEAYTALLTGTIEQEFEHNLAQQIYLSEECWNLIKTSKNSTINNIRKMASKEEIKSAEELRHQILTSLLDKSPPTETALTFLKKEVKNLL